MRTDAEVQKNAVRLERGDRSERAGRGKRTFVVLHTIGAQLIARGRDGIGIPIDTEDGDAGAPQKCRMTTAAERRINGAAAASGPGLYCLGQDRDMVRRTRF